jgi:hypothetical protein
MSQKDFFRLCPRGWLTAQKGDFRTRFAIGRGVIDDRRRVVRANATAGSELLLDWHPVRLREP